MYRWVAYIGQLTFLKGVLVKPSLLESRLR